MQSRNAKKSEKRHLLLSRLVPCLACALFHDEPDTPAEYHHTSGKTAPDCHFKGFSLCVNHHRIKDSHKPPRWISRHGDGLAAFEQRYRPESSFVLEHKRALKVLEAMTV